MKSLKDEIDISRLPSHIAIIMDGNGRWAKMRGLERHLGHQEGVISVREITEAAGSLGIQYVTIYAFSTENWNRPNEEVRLLMDLMVYAIHRETPDLMKNNVRLKAVGDLKRLPEKTRQTLDECIQTTAENTGITLILALSYSARWEIVEAAKMFATDVQSGKRSVEDLDEELFTDYMQMKDIPEPDLLIRTGGEKRISNFLLWQLSYSELYFTDVFWPDFREKELYEAILSYQQRERRFGMTSEQIIL